MSARHHIASRRVKIENIRELRQNTDDGSTLEVTFDLKDSGVEYKTAQNLAMFPQNSDSDVQFVLKHLRIADSDFHTKYRLVPNSLNKKSASAKHPIPSPFTPFEAVKKFIDLKGAVSKKTLKSLASFCSKQAEIDKMNQISADKALLQSEITAKHLGLIDIFRLFPSCMPDLGALI